MRRDQHLQDEGVSARTEEEPAIVWDFARPILVSRFFLEGVHSAWLSSCSTYLFCKALKF
jgi:hypothetical protein